MQVHRSAVEVVVQAPAKLNLFFEVLAKRDDGYHEIESLMWPVGLYDTLYFRKEPSGQLTFRCERAVESGVPGGAEIGAVPLGGDNLVVRAVELLRERAGVQAGAALRLLKRIPVAAGLGGGSSDAAAALAAANLAWDLKRPRAELAAMAAELGSDVPFFLGGGPAVCRGRGERVEPFGGQSLYFVVVRPPQALSTAQVYGCCRPARQPRHLTPLLDALREGNIGRAGRLLFNRLQPAAERLSPWIARLRDRFAAEDVLGHSMSGSGTSYFGLCRHARHARRVARRLQAGGAGSAFAVPTCR